MPCIPRCETVYFTHSTAGTTESEDWEVHLHLPRVKNVYSEMKCNRITNRMKLEPIIQSEVSQKDKDQYSILMHIYRILKDGNNNPICKTEKETQMYRTDF